MPDEATKPPQESSSELETASEETEPEHFEPVSFLDALKGAFPRQRLNVQRKPRAQRPQAQPATGTAEDAARVNFIDKRERTIASFLALFQIILGIVVYFEARHYVKHPGKGVSVHEAHIQTLNTQHSAPWLLAINLVLGLGIAGGVLSKRRALVGFMIFLGGLAMNVSGGGFLGIVYIGVGMWLVFRAMRKNPRRPAAAASTSRTSDRASTASRRSSKTPAATTVRTPPPASKRYTPPTQKKRSAPKPPITREPEPEPAATGGLRGWAGRRFKRDQLS